MNRVFLHGELHVEPERAASPRVAEGRPQRPLTNQQVAIALRLSVRQVRRLKRCFEAGGAPALCHRSRGRPSRRRLGVGAWQAADPGDDHALRRFDDTYLTEKLREEHGLRIYFRPHGSNRFINTMLVAREPEELTAPR